MANYSLSATATTDLAQIRNFYRRRNAEQVASNLIAQIRDTFQLLAQHPYIGIERRFVPGIRSFPVSGTPYIVLYFPNRMPLEIYRVVHGSQDLERLFE